MSEIAWIADLNRENLAIMYEVAFDIDKEYELVITSGVVEIRLVKLDEIGPDSNPPKLDTQYENRLKAVKLLKGRGIVAEFQIVRGDHRWYDRVAIQADRERIRHLASALDEESKRRASVPTVAEKTYSPPRRVFIGHGRSMVWRELKDFLADRLNLPWDEFNREASAGHSTRERLSKCLARPTLRF